MFWDVGRVLLSNGWDIDARAAAMRKFDIDADDFEARHKLVDEAWECGRITLASYLESTVFYRRRAFTADEFRDFMLAQSQDSPDGHRVADEVAQSGHYSMFTLNNEAAELNVYRISRFGLRKSFSAFFSSCFLGTRKPGVEIYRRALEITQREPAECVFIDDRAENLVSAKQLGMHTIQFRDGAQLRSDLGQLGVAWQPSA
jgi:putative hydrolase of the HAD superfamily